MEKPESKIENSGELRRFIYRDNSVGGQIIFKCVARGILEADKMYEAETGKNPEKQNHIGCSTEEIGLDEIE